MKSFIIAVCLVLCASVAIAGPLVVCDPYPDTSKPTHFKVSVDQGAAQNITYSLHSSGAAKVFDVANVDEAAHTLAIQACNERGCSSTVNFTIPAVPGAISGTRLEP